MPWLTATIVIHSTPVTLGTVTTDGTGSFGATVTVPADLEAGRHSLVAYGVDPSGDPHSIRMNITVAEAGVGAVTPSGARPGSLAYTGSTMNPLPYLVTGGALVLGGIVLLVVVRSRRQPGGGVEDGDVLADEHETVDAAPVA